MLDPDRVAVSFLFGLFAWIFAHAWVRANAGKLLIVQKAHVVESVAHWSTPKPFDLEQNTSFKVNFAADSAEVLPCSTIAHRKECKSLQHCSYHTARGCIPRNQQNLMPKLKAMISL
jgi:hypothetical protein